MTDTTGWNNASKENLKKLSGLKFYIEEQEADFRITAADRAKLSSVFENNNILRKKISDYCQQKCIASGSEYNPSFFAAVECDVSETYIRKIIRGDKPVSRKFLGQFCVGMGLTPEETDELFALTGKKLVFGYTYFDSITMCAVRDGDNIEDYLRDLEFYSDSSIR